MSGTGFARIFTSLAGFAIGMAIIGKDLPERNYL
jgi:uncharacterized membrane protein YccC